MNIVAYATLLLNSCMVDEIQMRSKAVVSGIPITTTIAALTSTVEGLMDKHDFGRFEVCSLQEYHGHVKK